MLKIGDIIMVKSTGKVGKIIDILENKLRKNIVMVRFKGMKRGFYSPEMLETVDD